MDTIKKIWPLLTVFSAILFGACSDEAITVPAIEEEASSMTMKSESPSLIYENSISTKIVNQQAKEELFSYLHDSQQTETFRASDYFALAMVEVQSNNPEIIEHMYSFVQEQYNEDGEAEFAMDDFCNTYPTDCTLIDGYLAGIMPSSGSLSELDNMMEWDEDYRPGILFENYETTDWTLAPIITPGIDVDDELYPEITASQNMLR